jgi:hypothetical protein
MATVIDLGKLRFEYRGEWTNATTYEANDVVKYGGNLYVYKYGLKTSGNIPQTSSLYWDLMVEGFKFEGSYDSDTTYNVGDGFSYGGIVYITTANSISGTRPPNAGYSTFTDGLQYEGEWSNSTQYQKSDIVKYGPKSYIASADPTIGSNPLTGSWQIFSDGISFDSAYDSTVTYKPGQVTKWGNNSYIANQDIGAGDSPNVAGNWTQIIEGQSWKDSYNSLTKYYEHDIVTFATRTYKSKRDNLLNVRPDTNTALWQLIGTGLKAEGIWSGSTVYYVDQLATYGNTTYRAKAETINQVPDVTPAVWEEIASGVDTRGSWGGGTLYYKGDIIVNGNKSYIKNASSHTSNTTFDSDNSNWTTLTDGVRYRAGGYDSSTSYLINDIVQYSTSSYIALENFNASGNFGSELTAGKWELLAAGGGSVLPSLAVSDKGKFLGSTDGVAYSWQYPGKADKVYYVAENGNADSDLGQTVDTAWGSLKFALENVTGPATIFVKDGRYRENLPMTIPANITLKGDGQRNTEIHPAAGDSSKTMFFVNSGVLVEELKFTGLTGFALDATNPHDIEEATIGGVYFRLDPTAVILKSPYIKESTAFSTGGVGAVIDGGLNNNPANQGSMVFHTFTQVHNGGAGFHVRKNGKSEIVSCFTYYCDFGLVTSSGGKIRALNCNNSYGTYGAVAEGFDSNEVAITGKIRGTSLHYDGNTITGGTEFNVGSKIVGETSNEKIDRATRAANVSFHSPNHGLTTGQKISITGLTPSTWASLFTADSYWVTATDSSNFIPYIDSARSTGIDTQNAGGRNTVTTTITDIARQNPVRLTVTTAANADSYAPHYIQSVGGMTQMNNRWVTFDSGAATSASTLFARIAENTKIQVKNAGTQTELAGTTGGSTLTFGSANPAITLYRGSRYRFIGDSASAVTKSVAGGRFYLSTSTSWDSSNFTDEYTTGILNSRNNLDGDSTLDSTVDGLLFEVGPTTPTTLYYNFDSATSASQMRGQINIVNPPFIDAQSYSVYTSGGQARLMDSGDYFDSAHWNAEAPTADVINSQASEDKIYVENITFPGFSGGELISQGAVNASLANSNFYRGQYGYIVSVDTLTGEPKPGASISFAGDADSAGQARAYVVSSVSGYGGGAATITLSQQKLETNASADDVNATIRTNYSQVRLTGHDFLSVGTGGVTTTNYPGTPTQPASQGNEVIETAPGRVYFISTDQDGNFRVGNYFRIDQATGRATLDASAFDLSGLTSLRLGSIGAQIGESINEFSSDATLSGNSNLAVPTEKATKGYVDEALNSLVDAIGAGNYDSANTIWATGASTGNPFLDSDRGDSGGRRALGYTIGPITISDIDYDSYTDEIKSYKEKMVLGFGFTEEKSVVITYNSDGSIERIQTTVL